MKSIPSAELNRRRRAHTRAFAVLLSGVTLVALLAISDRGRARSDPLEERADYATALRRCYGDLSVISAPPPPKTDAEREAARARCVADRKRIERACR